MAEIKGYMRNLMEEILQEVDMSPEERDAAIRSLSKAFESMSNEEYMITMGQAFSGKGDLGAVEDFLSTTFEMPDLQGVSQEIFDGVTQFLRENLPGLKHFDESVQEEVVTLNEEQVA